LRNENERQREENAFHHSKRFLDLARNDNCLYRIQAVGAGDPDFLQNVASILQRPGP